MKEVNRIAYFDIAKGMLILGLLISHFRVNCTHLGIISGFRYLDMFIITYSGFFMQCFFFISGFCSSFNISAKTFLSKLFRQLVLPLFFFDVINFTLNKMGVQTAYNVFTFPTYLNYLWFIRALIIAKIIVWAIRKISISDYALLGITFILWIQMTYFLSIL